MENLYFHHYRARAPGDHSVVGEDAANTPHSTEEDTARTSSGSQSTLLPPAKLIPHPSRTTSISPSTRGTPSATLDSIAKRPGRTTPYSPYSPSPSTALALAASPNYGNIQTRTLSISAGGSPTPYTHPPTTAATYINAGNSRPSVPATSTLTTNPYSMTNLSRLGATPIPNRGNSASSPSVMWPNQHPKGASGGGAQTYDSFWSLLSSGGSLPAPGPIVVPIVTNGGGDASINLSSRAKTSTLLVKRAGIHKKTTGRSSKFGGEAD